MRTATEVQREAGQPPLLVIGIIYAYKHSETFRKIVQATWKAIRVAVSVVVGWLTKTAWPAIKTILDRVSAANRAVLRVVQGVWNGIVRAVSGPLGSVRRVVDGVWSAVKSVTRAAWAAVSRYMTGPVSSAASAVRGTIDRLISFFRGVGRRVSGAFSGAFYGIKSAFRSAINGVIGLWNRLHFTIPSIHIPGLGSVGGGTIWVPQMPYLATGGITTGPTLAMIGDNPGGREAIIPLDRYNLGGNTFNITVNAPVGASSADIGRALTRHIDAYERAGGRRRAA